MTNKNIHSFDACSLRSSSLLIVHHEQQVIVTASDELFNILGYHSGQLIEQPLSLLSLSTKNGKRFQRVQIQHAKTKQWIKLKICIHHDPFSTCSGLDYCLVALADTQASSSSKKEESDHQCIKRKKQEQTNANTATVNLIGLNSYGTIIHAYPTIHFPQINSRQLLGRPIMSFVHDDDIIPLCQLLRKSTSGELYNYNNSYNNNNNTTFYYNNRSALLNEATISIRWLYSCLDQHQYEWMQLTVVNPSIYNQVPSLSGHPICILQPIEKEKSNYYYHSIYDYISTSIEDGKNYCDEFLHHVTMSLIQLIYVLTPKKIIERTILPVISSSTSSATSLTLISKTLLMNPLKEQLFYLIDSYAHFTGNLFDFISTVIHYHVPNDWLPDINSFDFLKPILPQTKTPSTSI
ncbi:unnamed protein product [Cunninghamella blakesleeana]